MKAKLIAMLVLACLVTVSAKVAADDHGGHQKSVPVLSVVNLDDIDLRREGRGQVDGHVLRDGRASG